jgi:hypothetical protein
VDANVAGLLSAIAAGDLEAVLILCDLLEERGDPRSSQLRALYNELHDDWVYAPFSFRHLGVLRHRVLPWFPEYETED